MRVIGKPAEYFLQHILHPNQHIIVPEMQHTITIGFQIARSFLIEHGTLNVLATIHLHDQTPFKT